MQEHEINSLNNFICGWYSDDTIICDKIIDFHKNSNLKKPGVIGNVHLNNVSQLLLDTKNSIDCVLDTDYQLTGEYISHLQLAVDLYIKKYPYCNESSAWSVMEQINVQHYTPPNGGYHSWHCERGSYSYPSAARHLVFMTYLNTVDDGGETEFYHQQLKIKPVKGLTLIWPADWTHTHRGIESPSEEKYIVTGWFSFISKEDNNA